jgi:hypothetical protein
MLHALLLGIFKYVRDCFFEQVGEKSQLATEINAIAITYSTFYARQSDRDMPITQFSNGIEVTFILWWKFVPELHLLALSFPTREGKCMCFRKID